MQAQPFDDNQTRPFFSGPLPEGQLRRLIAQQFHVSGQNDFALLYASSGGVLAPFYDTLCTAVYPTLTPKMAMKIGSNYKFSEVQRRPWEQLAQAAGLGMAQTKKRVLEWAKTLPLSARKLQADPAPGFSQAVLVEQIVTLIEQRCALTIWRLTGGGRTDY